MTSTAIKTTVATIATVSLIALTACVPSALAPSTSTDTISAPAATIGSNQIDVETVSVSSISKTITVNISGNAGHIVAGDNCTVNADGNIEFIDADTALTVGFIADDGYDAATVKTDGVDAVLDNNYLYVAPHTISLIDVKFADIVVVEQNTGASESQEQATESSSKDTASVSTSSSSTSFHSTAAATSSSVSTSAPAASSSSSSSRWGTSLVSSYNHASAMDSFPHLTSEPTNEEATKARQIFEAYNNYRASQGLVRVVWNDDLAAAAWKTSEAEAGIRQLSHRIYLNQIGWGGHDVSDILEYSSWEMSADEAVTGWKKSAGHNAMMLCTTARVAGVGCYNNNGTWFYTIVYDFAGYNQN